LPQIYFNLVPFFLSFTYSIIHFYNDMDNRNAILKNVRLFVNSSS